MSKVHPTPIDLLRTVDLMNKSLPQAEGIVRVVAFAELHEVMEDRLSIANALFAAADLIEAARLTVGVIDRARRLLKGD